MADPVNHQSKSESSDDYLSAIASDDVVAYNDCQEITHCCYPKVSVDSDKESDAQEGYGVQERKQYLDFFDDLQGGSCFPIHLTVIYKASKVLDHLLNNIENIDVRDGRGRTALHIACAVGDCATIKKLINCGALVNVLDQLDQCPYYYLINNHPTTSDDELLEMVAKNNYDDDHSRRILQLAYQRNRTLAVQLYSQGMRDNGPNDPSQMNVYLAIMAGDADQIKRWSPRYRLRQPSSLDDHPFIASFFSLGISVINWAVLLCVNDDEMLSNFCHMNYYYHYCLKSDMYGRFKKFKRIMNYLLSDPQHYGLIVCRLIEVGFRFPQDAMHRLAVSDLRKNGENWPKDHPWDRLLNKPLWVEQFRLNQKVREDADIELLEKVVSEGFAIDRKDRVNMTPLDYLIKTELDHQERGSLDHKKKIIIHRRVKWFLEVGNCERDRFDDLHWQQKWLYGSRSWENDRGDDRDFPDRSSAGEMIWRYLCTRHLFPNRIDIRPEVMREWNVSLLYYRGRYNYQEPWYPAYHYPSERDYLEQADFSWVMPLHRVEERRALRYFLLWWHSGTAGPWSRLSRHQLERVVLPKLLGPVEARPFPSAPSMTSTMKQHQRQEFSRLMSHVGRFTNRIVTVEEMRELQTEEGVVSLLLPSGKEITVDQSLLEASRHLNDLVSDIGTDSVIPVHNVSDATVMLALEWSKLLKKYPLLEVELSAMISIWNNDWLPLLQGAWLEPYDLGQQIELLILADQWDMPLLLDLLGRSLARKLRGLKFDKSTSVLSFIQQQGDEQPEDSGWRAKLEFSDEEIKLVEENYPWLRQDAALEKISEAVEPQGTTENS